MSVDTIRAEAEATGQSHLFDEWDSLNEEQQQQLLGDLKDIDFKYLKNIFERSTRSTEETATAEQEPAQDVLKLSDASAAQRQEWAQQGLQLIAEGKAAVLLLAGGQGTRLGSSLPKGLYSVGLPSNKSLFQLQAERVLRLQQLAAESVNGKGAAVARPLHWYIMTSPFTHQASVSHFEEHGYFGLQPSQVTFFQQGFLPCMTEAGQVILETSSKVAKAPDGNGGLYRALQLSGALEHMVKNGVVALDCYCVDNILAKVGDPEFLGYGYASRAECGARVLAKASPEEKVGVFVQMGGSLQVLEYSELDPTKASAVNPATGELFFNWSNICMHYFSVPWLQKVVASMEGGAAYHIARKKIPSKSGPVAGIKLEMFIFDTFPLASKNVLFEIERASQFAPVKNAPGSPTDSPDTARQLLLELHKRWVEAAGGKVTAAPGVEVSPLVSYAGEQLEDLVKGKTYDNPLVAELQGSAA